MTLALIVTPLLVLGAVLVVVGGVVTVAAPDPRHATVGAFAALLLAAVVVDPGPTLPALVARTAGAALGGWLVWIALRGGPRATSQSALGPIGAAGAAIGAFGLGWLAASALGALVATGVGDGLVADVPGATLAGGSVVARSAIAAAAALAVLASAPLVTPRDGHRMGLGVVLLMAAAALLSDALCAAPEDTLDLAFGVLAALSGAAIAAVTATMLRTGGDLVLRDAIAREPSVRHRAADDAHRDAVR